MHEQIEQNIRSLMSFDDCQEYAARLVTLWKKSWGLRQTNPDGSPIQFRGYHRYGPRTWHEELWAAWNPQQQPQVTFGTGKGGCEKYGCTSFTADFYDPWKALVIEVDGPSHSRRTQRRSDAAKTRFFRDQGIRVQRTRNQSIEDKAIRALAVAFDIVRRHVHGEETYAPLEFEVQAAKPLLALLSKTTILSEEVRNSWLVPPGGRTR